MTHAARSRAAIVGERLVASSLAFSLLVILPQATGAVAATTPARSRDWRFASFRGIGDLPGGRFHSEALAISDNGEVVVGRSSSAQFEEEGLLLVGDTLTALLGPAGCTRERCYGTTALGSQAFLWDATGGIRNLKEILVAAGVLAVDGWLLTEATGISADGRVVIGNGTNPIGQTEGWVARIPPVTAVQRKTWTTLREAYR